MILPSHPSALIPSRKIWLSLSVSLFVSLCVCVSVCVCLSLSLSRSVALSRFLSFTNPLLFSLLPLSTNHKMRQCGLSKPLSITTTTPNMVRALSGPGLARGAGSARPSSPTVRVKSPLLHPSGLTLLVSASCLLLSIIVQEICLHHPQ